MRINSQINAIIEHLKQGKSITQVEATKLCGTIRLGSIIHELRHKYNYNITTTMIQVKNRYGGVSEVAKYKLEVLDENKTK
nr:MAG TPA: helix-turn-helix domain protein [Caudoviricetes sp.]DAS16927.1 MAG TPA: helix-turn-helix domain protein [Caudoviricetes sp.]